MVAQTSIARALSLAAIAAIPVSSFAVQPSRASQGYDDEKCLKMAVSNSTLSNDCLKFRPKLHVMPSKGWLNDPCGPVYDSHKQTYHVGFQWVPGAIEWNYDVSWGAATSKDMINWEVYNTPSLKPEASYDHLGVFTGAALDMNINGVSNGTLTAAYTAVDIQPISWRLNYNRGAESLALAFSEDSGVTWQRYDGNIIIESGPEDVDLLSWRDPYISKWENVEKLLHNGETGKYLYGIISGGVRGTTPTTWLYEIDANALQNWRYVGPLVDLSMKFNPDPKWTGSFGSNWEVCNFVDLTTADKALRRDFLICGIEGKVDSTDNLEEQGVLRTDKAQTWLRGGLSKKGDSVRMAYENGGQLDYGMVYATNSFFDPISQSHIFWGWVFEEDLPERYLLTQFFAGILTIPRTIEFWTVDNVIGSLASPLSEIGSIEVTPGSDGSSSRVSGLAGNPEPRLVGLRRKHVPVLKNKLGSAPRTKTTLCSRYEAMELQVSARVAPSSKDLGIRLHHANGEYTTIFFSAGDEQITIDRKNSTHWPDVRTVDEIAPHTLFQHADKSWETLELRVFFDRSSIEVFANNRTALTTRVYPISGAVDAVELLHERGDDSSAFLSADIWSLDATVTHVDS
ncbi:Extracellular exo-inulinase inuE [Ceratocystis lukuohia]|uniref:Extracellular exo-inulinase inuE n=1 Tax=Ceratocystis lukuohia TaxID=2019550 RepID=A0ABR4MBW2_9PEZI